VKKTTQELRDERARQLDIIDDVLKTAAEAKRSLTDEERATHDDAVAAIETPETGLDAEIARALIEDGDILRSGSAEARRNRYAVPNINTKGAYSVGAGVTRDLDELLWAQPPKRSAAATASQPSRSSRW
jgi:hypothetical protein